MSSSLLPKLSSSTGVKPRMLRIKSTALSQHP
jgi:hypothetical protein